MVVAAAEAVWLGGGSCTRTESFSLTPGGDDDSFKFFVLADLWYVLVQKKKFM